VFESGNHEAHELEAAEGFLGVGGESVFFLGFRGVSAESSRRVADADEDVGALDENFSPCSVRVPKKKNG
jgi:hypothetical protein